MDYSSGELGEVASDLSMMGSSLAGMRAFDMMERIHHKIHKLYMERRQYLENTFEYNSVQLKIDGVMLDMESVLVGNRKFLYRISCRGSSSILNYAVRNDWKEFVPLLIKYGCDICDADFHDVCRFTCNLYLIIVDVCQWQIVPTYYYSLIVNHNRI